MEELLPQTHCSPLGSNKENFFFFSPPAPSPPPPPPSVSVYWKKSVVFRVFLQRSLLCFFLALIMLCQLMGK